eukprot:scaffold52_cov290-Prasinococcus_capsulatus_cf.AAC.1
MDDALVAPCPAPSPWRERARARAPTAAAAAQLYCGSRYGARSVANQVRSSSHCACSSVRLHPASMLRRSCGVPASLSMKWSPAPPPGR